jgi:hypothetical protein
MTKLNLINATMQKVLKIEKVHDLHGSTNQIRVKLFSKIVFKFSFKQTLKTV